eukprot:TRINITY_DN25679_c0_g1_i1.p1 TRINITY_DN25679_c0_g1~~TRINITY_DN25679_c0_g1_i1.p1  ORF type:complete len:355 (+),score=38.27 TRINITY_DN25679_c0_g1_i1:29-1093(+)
MADHDSNAEEEEEEEHKVISLNNKAAVQQLIQEERKKVVVVAFCIPGNPNSDNALKWMKSVSRDSVGENAIIVQLDPNQLPDLARENELQSVPTFVFYWRGTFCYKFSGTNLDKFRAALGKALHARHETVSEEAKWHKTLKVIPGNNLQKDDKVHILEILPETTNLIIGLGWSGIENEEGQKEPVNIDIYALMATEQGRLASLSEVISTSNTEQHNVKFFGSSRKGEDGEGDEVSFDVRLDEPPFPAHLHDIIFVGIIPPNAPNPTLTSATDFYIRGFDVEHGKCLFKYDISELEIQNENCIYFGKVYLTGQKKWKFHAQGDIQQTTYEEIEAKMTEVIPKKPTRKKKAAPPKD